MTIEILPLDTLFFRDGKPFNASSETWADGIFPPNPSTIYGALRSIYFRNNPDDLSKANEVDDPTKNLVIRKIYLKISLNHYFPLPLDIVYEKGSNTYTYPLERKENSLISNIKTTSILTKDFTIENFENSFITIKRFKKYQSFTNDKFIQHSEIKNLENFIKNESKIGIKINKTTQTSDKGHLYRVDFKRLEKTKIVVEFDGLDIGNTKLIRLGGEGKVATCKEIEDLKIEPPQNIQNIFKLYLLTPTIFDNGWLPSWIDEDSLEGEFRGLKLKLLTAKIGKYKLIGGFDMKEQKPKMMYKAVSEGSIYYFELLEGDISQIIKNFHNQSISDKLSNEGYGIVFVGEAK